ncbi:hypothetical protein IQ31_01359 [Sphingobacterium siyangense]|uniref:Uncharacterized protein n=2 Tax=Sphingobacteriaceae TaxID=84566 RepID=A0A562MRV5_9SPHI|nr:hypothetical protein IQ31_01359 [Sphingobacterium siyangense]
MTMTTKKTTLLNTVEYGVDARYNSQEEKQNDAQLLMQARKDRMARTSEQDIMRAKLMQLKLQIDEYLNSAESDVQHQFTSFLNTYINTIYEKQQQFAQDLDITPVSLSQILNNHREPKEEFFKKLMIHSERIFKAIKGFHKQSWYQVYYRDKINETMAHQDEWREELEKKIKFPAFS